MKSRTFFIAMLAISLSSVCLFSCNDDDDDDSGSSAVEQGTTVELSASDNTDDGYFDGSLYYRIISKSKKTVAVAKAAKDALNVVIPAFVVIDGKKYTVREIDEYAFRTDKDISDLGKGYVKSVVWPTTIKKVAYRAFFQCENLKRVDIYDLPSFMKTEFGESAANPLFYDARLYVNGQELKELTVPDNITKILPYAFDGCASITKVNIHDKVTEVGKNAFCICSNLTDVVFGKGVKTIGSYAFFACDALENVTFGNNITTIGKEAFHSCKIKNMTLPDKLTVIEYEAFRKCKELKTFNLPAGVKEIGSDAFFECNALSAVYSYIKNPYQVKFNFNPFPTDTPATLYVPKGSLDDYKAIEMWSKFNLIKEGDY